MAEYSFYQITRDVEIHICCAEATRRAESVKRKVIVQFHFENGKNGRAEARSFESDSSWPEEDS